MAIRNRSIDSVVAFVNSQKFAGQGTLISLSRNAVTFEVYNPYSIVQLSEVLDSVAIRQGEREIYRGRGVVTNLISTGMMLIVTASLVDPWSDVANLKPGPVLRDAVNEFIDDWTDSNSEIIPEYRTSVSQLRNFLSEFSRWLEHGETVTSLREAADDSDLRQQFTKDVDVCTLETIKTLYLDLELIIRQVPKKLSAAHKALAQRELHPLILCAPFVHRSFTKPLGYAGDYLMVQMMLGDPFQGPNTFARIVNASTVRQEAPAAHRNRIVMLKNQLVIELQRASKKHTGMLRVLNVGCGPAEEVAELMRETPLADKLNIRLVDFNEETLQYVGTALTEVAAQTGRQTRFELIQQSVNDLIRQAMEEDDDEHEMYDMVYCAGLFDYFGDPTCEALLQLFYRRTSPGGLVMTTNVTPDHSTMGIMSHLLEWNLKTRDSERMKRLAQEVGPADSYSDDTGVNVFLRIRKPLTSEPS